MGSPVAPVGMIIALSAEHGKGSRRDFTDSSVDLILPLIA